MAVSWTDEQKKAIEKNGCNLIVAAAAGSGKTAVLVEKIVNLIESGADIDSLLVTTFTDAAAKKMKQEIADEIKKRLLADTGNAHLSRQLVLLGHADICTIDAFCMKTVRANFHLLDIDPDFKIADKNECELLLMQAVEDVFGELYENNDEQFYSLLECYASQRGDDALSEIVIFMHKSVVAMPDYKEWLNHCKNMYAQTNNVFESEWGKVIKQSTRIVIDECIKCATEAYEYAVQTDEVSSYVVPLGLDTKKLKEISDVLDTDDFDAVGEKIREFKMEGGGRAKAKTPDEVKAPLTGKREYVKKRMAKLAEGFYYADSDGVMSELSYTGEQVCALCRLVELVEESFFEIKKKRGVLDFGDIEHLALQALSDMDENGNLIPSAAALELRDKYEMILIDEYQDSNELQETIFSRICRDDNIFMVGDLKQSIYRFRHTNPLLFKHKKDTYQDDEGINQRVIMSKNFRSRKQIIDGVNFIMAQNASPLVGEMEYDETETLNLGAQYPDDDSAGGAVEMHIIGGEIVDETEDGDETVFGAEAEAVCVAKRIIQLRRDGFQVFDKKEGLRPVKYRDIVILMRAPGVDAQMFSEVLTSFGIPTFSDVDGGYFMTQEIELMLSLLSVIDNPVQDIKLLGVMRSVIGGFCDCELTDIRIYDSESDIYGAVCSCAKNDTELGRKCAYFLARLEVWREKALHMSVHELIWYLYNDTGYYNFSGAGTVGEQRTANLKLLIEYARSYEKTSFKGLFNFVSYIERVKNAKSDVGGAKILGENQDVVRIMSIHKSKGLEFGVVFVCRLAKKFNKMDLSKPVLMHGELGIGVDFIDINNRYRYPTLIKRAISEQKRYELMSEELRVLYVALTRAREKLIMTMAPTNLEGCKKRWLDGAKSDGNTSLPLYYTTSASGIGDWIMGAIMRHESCRKFAGEYVSCPDSEASFEVFSSPESMNMDNVSEKNIEAVRDDENYTDIINEALGYVYPHEGVRKIPTKVSVTELKRIVNSEIDATQAQLYGIQLVEAPSFMCEKVGMNAAQRGSALHFVMQHLDLTQPLDEQGVMAQIEHMLDEQIITTQQADAVCAKKASNFFESSLGQRMIASGHVVRESPFEVFIDADEIVGDDVEGEEVLLQGIIDCYFYENDEIVLVDYKTDSAKSRYDVDKIKQRYEPQLTLYAHALEKITNIHVKEKNLYLFSCESVVHY